MAAPGCVHVGKHDAEIGIHNDLVQMLDDATEANTAYV